MADNNQVDVFTADEHKSFSELRLNSIVETIARQRDQAYNSGARADAELAVKSAQVTVLSTKLIAQATMMNQMVIELNSIRDELLTHKVEVVELPPTVEESGMGDTGYSTLESTQDTSDEA